MYVLDENQSRIAIWTQKVFVYCLLQFDDKFLFFFFAILILINILYIDICQIWMPMIYEDSENKLF